MFYTTRPLPDLTTCSLRRVNFIFLSLSLLIRKQSTYIFVEGKKGGLEVTLGSPNQSSSTLRASSYQRKKKSQGRAHP